MSADLHQGAENIRTWVREAAELVARAETEARRFESLIPDEMPTAFAAAIVQSAMSLAADLSNTSGTDSSVSDLVGYADEFAALVERLGSNPRAAVSVA